MTTPLTPIDILNECLRESNGDTEAALLACEYILSTDASGHQHKGKGPGGGQFTGSKKDSAGRVRHYVSGKPVKTREEVEAATAPTSSAAPTPTASKTVDTAPVTHIADEFEKLQHSQGGGRVKVPDLYDSLKRLTPSLTLEGFHKQLLDLERNDYLNIGRVNDPRLESRYSEMIPDPGGMTRLGYVLFRPGAVDALRKAGATLSISAFLSHDIHNRLAQGILNRTLKAARGLSAAARKDLTAALKLDPTGTSSGQAIVDFVNKYRLQLARLLTTTQLASLLEGAREVAVKIPDIPEVPVEGLPIAEQEQILTPPPTSLPIKAPKPEPGSPEEIHFPTIDNAVEDLSSRNVLTRDQFDVLDAAARAKAFTVAGVQAEETLTAIRDSLTENVREGADYETWKGKVLQGVDEGTFLSDAHQETVFRTNIQSAFSDGQASILAHPLVRSGFPYSAYDAIHDDRVRENHLALEKCGIGGTNVYRNDDPVFQLFRPPWDYNDRCSWTPITVRHAAEKGIPEAVEWLATGVEPSAKAFVPMPPFSPPPGFQRALNSAPLSIRLSLQPLISFSAPLNLDFVGYRTGGTKKTVIDLEGEEVIPDSTNLPGLHTIPELMTGRGPPHEIRRKRRTSTTPANPFVGEHPRNNANQFIDKYTLVDAANNPKCLAELRDSIPEDQRWKLDQVITHLQMGGTVHHPSEPPGFGIDLHGDIPDENWAKYQDDLVAWEEWNDRNEQCHERLMAANRATRTIRRKEVDYDENDAALEEAGASKAELRAIAKLRHRVKRGTEPEGLLENLYEETLESIYWRLERDENDDKEPEEPEVPAISTISVAFGFDPNEKRDDSGKWTAGGGSGKSSEVEEVKKHDSPDAAAAAAEYKTHGTKAKAFKSWFGDWEADPANASKVVNTDGEPQETHGTAKKVFHGRTYKFDAFDKAKQGQNGLDAGPGFYFAEKKELAQGFAIDEGVLAAGNRGELFHATDDEDDEGEAPATGKMEEYLLECYLSIKNPLDFDMEMGEDELKRWEDALAEKVGDKAEEAKAKFREQIGEIQADPRTQSPTLTAYIAFQSLRSTIGDYTNRKEENSVLNDVFKSIGYDGVTHISSNEFGTVKRPESKGPDWGRVWVAFEPEQIKHVDNAGTFDPNNPNIAFGNDSVDSESNTDRLQLISEIFVLLFGKDAPAQARKFLSGDNNANLSIFLATSNPKVKKRYGKRPGPGWTSGGTSAKGTPIWLWGAAPVGVPAPTPVPRTRRTATPTPTPPVPTPAPTPGGPALQSVAAAAKAAGIGLTGAPQDKAVSIAAHGAAMAKLNAGQQLDTADKAALALKLTKMPVALLKSLHTALGGTPTAGNAKATIAAVKAILTSATPAPVPTTAPTPVSAPTPTPPAPTSTPTPPAPTSPFANVFGNLTRLSAVDKQDAERIGQKVLSGSPTTQNDVIAMNRILSTTSSKEDYDLLVAMGKTPITTGSVTYEQQIKDAVVALFPNTPATPAPTPTTPPTAAPSRLNSLAPHIRDIGAQVRSVALAEQDGHMTQADAEAEIIRLFNTITHSERDTLISGLGHTTGRATTAADVLNSIKANDPGHPSAAPSPPGPPPRPGLIWNPTTHRWILAPASTVGATPRATTPTATPTAGSVGATIATVISITNIPPSDRSNIARIAVDIVHGRQISAVDVDDLDDALHALDQSQRDALASAMGIPLVSGVSTRRVILNTAQASAAGTGVPTAAAAAATAPTPTAKPTGYTRVFGKKASAAATAAGTATLPPIPYKDEENWESGKAAPASLNGIDFKPAPPKFWEKTPDVDIGEPPTHPGVKVHRASVMIQEPDGRIWIVQPTNEFGGRKYTLPGGGVEPGLTDQQNALKEVWEETGLQVEITGHIGDFQDSNYPGSKTKGNGRLYIGRRIGGAPWDAKVESHIISNKTGKPAAESEKITLVTPERAEQLLNRTDDIAQLYAGTTMPIRTPASGTGSEPLKKLVKAIQPAAQDWLKKQQAAGSSRPGNQEMHAVQELRGFNVPPTLVSKKEMDDLIKAGDHIEMLRGVAGSGSKNANQLAEEFRTGDHYPGHGIFGSGTYADSNKHDGGGNYSRRNVASNGQYGTAVIRMVLPKTARIAKLSELEKLIPKAPDDFKGHNNPGGKSAVECWLGVQAVLAGYDAIEVDGNSIRHGDYLKGGYVILNRGAVIVQKENAAGHQIK